MYTFFICDFIYLTGFDVRLMQIQICCHKASHTMDITPHRARNYFSLYEIKCSPYKI